MPNRQVVHDEVVNEIAVYLVDDQLPFLKVAAAVVRATDGFRVVGCATSSEHAVDQIVIRGHDLGLVLLDVEMPVLDGPAVARRVAERWPTLPIVYLSARRADELADDVWQTSVVGFIDKASFGPASLLDVRELLLGRGLP